MPNLELEDVIKMASSGVPDQALTDVSEVSVVPATELSDDEICCAVKEEEVPETVLQAVLWGLAEEQASLKDLRKSRGIKGMDTSPISMKRGTLLKYMSDTLIQKQALAGGSGELDLKSPKFREVFKMFLSIISDTFDEVKIPVEYREMFFHALSKNLEGWEERAEKVTKSIVLPRSII